MKVESKQADVHSLLFQVSWRHHKDFTKRVNKAGLQPLLTTKVLGAVDKLSVADFMKAMKQARKTIFHRDDVLVIGKEGQVHGSCLQMMARGLIALRVADNTKAGTDKLTRTHLCVVCPNAKRVQDGNILQAPGYMRDECWKGFNLC